MKRSLAVGLAVSSLAGTANAGQVSAVGKVLALTNFDQMSPLTGTAAFDEGPLNQSVPLDLYAAQGLTWVAGDFQAIFPGIMATGTALAPYYQTGAASFPQPIKNGGVQNQNYVWFGGVARFSGDVTQVGLTAGKSGKQFLTAWDKQGKLIGQVSWEPVNDASFIGIDTKGVPIGLAAYGNDDMFGGATYNVVGDTIMADTWVWAKGVCGNDAACDDGDACNGAETCMAGECVAGAPLECTDDNTCTDDACDPVDGCVFTNNVGPCDDKDQCSQGTVCAGGVCAGGEQLACEDDDDVCTAEICDPVQGCLNDPIPGCCNDDAACLRDETCDLKSNTCVPDAPNTTTGDSSTGEATTAEGTSTGDVTATEASTGEPDPTTGAPDPTTGGSETGGEPPTTTHEPETTDTPTTGGQATTDAGSTGTGTDTDATETTSIDDDSGCGCRSPGAGDNTLGALASLGLGLLLRRRRRAV